MSRRETTMPPPFIVKSVVWEQVAEKDNLDSDASIKLTISHTCGMTRKRVEGSMKELHLKANIEVGGLLGWDGPEKKMSKVTVDENTYSDSYTEATEIFVAPFRHLQVFQKVLNCATVRQGKEVSFQLRTVTTKILTHKRGERKPSVPAERLDVWDGSAECKKCGRMFSLLRNVGGGCMHSDTWHSTFGDCSKIKCLRKIGVRNVGLQHWGCCGITDRLVAECPESSPHVADLSSDVIKA